MAWLPVPHFAHAACRDSAVATDIFFTGNTDRARKICAGCQHQLECRDYGLALPHWTVGIFGGLSRKERLAERRARRSLALESCASDGDDERIDDTTELDTSPPDALPATNGSARTCSICGTELAPNRQRTCGPECAAEHERRRESSRERNRKTTSTRSGSIEPLTTAWPQPLAALVDAGARIDQVNLDVAGETWILTRSK
jgi:hypothetical protein